jgi:glutathione S-transferase
LRLNPAGKVPVLVDGDIVIPESAAIVLALIS